MAFDLVTSWNTGGINTRTTNACAVLSNGGEPFIIAPVQHGVKCFNKTGTLQWTYTGITNGYDVRDIKCADLTGSGYADCVVVASGYYNTGKHIAIINKNGNELACLQLSGTTNTQTLAIDGTDIYVTTNIGITKLVKSGSTWVEDTTNWAKNIGSGGEVKIADMGNGKRVYAAFSTTQMGVKCFQTNGTQDWFFNTGNQYTRIFAIGKLDKTKTGLQMSIPYQSGHVLIDKDGNSFATIPTGNNVRVSVCLYDCDKDGEDEIYFSDMGNNVYCFDRTGTNTYTQLYLKTALFAAGKYGGLVAYDIDKDGDKEIIALSQDGYLYVYDKTLTTLKKSIFINHGVVGGYYLAYQHHLNGIYFADLNSDNVEDIVVAGSTGYVDTILTTGVSGGGQPIFPVITIAPYNTNPTNQNVVVNASTDVGTLNTTTYVFTTNGSFDFIANYNGNITTKTVTITNIDKVAPIITINPYSTEPTNQNITVTATTNKGSLNANSHLFTENGSFDFVATDSAGNVTTVTVTITNINKTPTENGINIVSVSKSKISDKVGMDECAVVFNSITKLMGWEARATDETQTPSVGVGLLVGDGSTLLANSDCTFTVENEELTNGDRTYTVTIYAVDGTIEPSEARVFAVNAFKVFEISPTTFLDISGGGVAAIREVQDIGSCGNRLYINVLYSNAIYELSPNTLLNISGNGVNPTSATSGGKIGGTSNKLFYVNANNKIFELSPDTRLSIGGDGITCPSSSVRGSTGGTTDRLFYVSIRQPAPDFIYVSTLYEFNPLTMLNMSGSGRDISNCNIESIDGANNRLIATISKKICEIDKTTGLNIGVPVSDIVAYGIAGTKA